MQENPNIPSGRLLALASVLLIALLGCGEADQTSNDPQAGPTSAGRCNDLPLVGSDGGLVLGTDWSSETHRYDEPAELTVCVTTSDSDKVRVSASDEGVTVTPATQVVPTDGDGLMSVKVTVASGTPSGTALRVKQFGRGVFGDASGPVIVTTDDGWHFDRA